MTTNSCVLQPKPKAKTTSMASHSQPIFLFFLIWAAFIFQGTAGSRTLVLLPQQNTATTEKQLDLQVKKVHIASNTMMRRRSMIGSVKPTCTYNECRGCRSRCRAEQVPVEGNDPINSAYHYRCICHR
ncbi:EPIDERMAL PATTERNING FACTOR-like protein 9 isoform X1 [Helianthus annuus]|uniref:EPIDERMAL PATTERNING FACTOR-like protein 9 isoform X1 n=1 Tax=Helianthus annuus TaxID=4232 RepID=UPI000B8F9962|nr:EPIDERMAL PATTERNING FACTOR-like protein 9 isoform X1 [Helianthus annuus]